jgi:hypothetical protein
MFYYTHTHTHTHTHTQIQTHFLFFFGGSQGLVLARQASITPAMPPALFAFRLFFREGLAV